MWFYFEQEKLNLFFLNKWQWISEDLWKCFLKLLIAESVRCFYLYCYWIHWNQFFNYRYVSDWYLLRTKLNLSHSEIDTFQLRSIYVHSRHFYMVPSPPSPPTMCFAVLCCVAKIQEYWTIALSNNSLYITLKLAGGCSLTPPPLGIFGLKFSPLDQLPNAFAQLFLDNGRHLLTLIGWRHHWWRHHTNWRKMEFAVKLSIFWTKND